MTAVARALIKKPEIILCDEPTGNLDQKTGKRLFNKIKEYLDENEGTLICVTHDESLCQEASFVGRMSSGELQLEESDKKEVSDGIS